jgi:Glyoxalase/Bleomycin resistance protein/Dioxygenase superfamily
MLEQSSAAQQLFSEFVQIGAVVQDIDQSMKVLAEVFGIGPWRVILWPPAGRADMDRIYYGQPAEFTARMAFAELGPIEIELIQPLTGESIWADYLAEHGPGLHHIRFNVPEMEPIIEHVAAHGIGVTQRANGIRPGTSWANFDTERLVGFTIEVMKPVPGTDGRTPAIFDGKVQG